MVHLEIADHHKACSIGATSDECSGVDPGVPVLLQELPVPKEADEGHHKSTHVANEAEEAALGGVCTTFADERNIIEGAAGLRAPLFSRVRRAGIIVGPVLHWAHVAVHHSHGIHSPYARDGEG